MRRSYLEGKASMTPARLVGLCCALIVLSRVSAPAVTYGVDRLTDGNPAGGGEGVLLVGDLRYALSHAQSGDGISISVTGTIPLQAVLPALDRSVCVHGPGANQLTVHGAGGSVFTVRSGATVTLADFAITGGVGHGGGIFNQGTLTLIRAVVEGNAAGDPTNGGGTGAGIWNDVGATLTLDGSTVSGNSAVGNLFYAPSRGGGIANYGTLTLQNSTVSGNLAEHGTGGGISNALETSVLILNDSTVSANTATGLSPSGGVDNRGTLTMRNTIIAGNAGGDVAGNVVSEGYNLVGTADGGGFDGTDLLDVTPLLGPLQDNGGPTPTMAPLPGSPAIDRTPGTPGVDFPATDQRGVPRPQGGLADTGGVELEVALHLGGFVLPSGAELVLSPRGPRAVEAADSSSPRSPIVRVDSANRGPARLLGSRFDVAECAP